MYQTGGLTFLPASVEVIFLEGQFCGLIEHVGMELGTDGVRRCREVRDGDSVFDGQVSEGPVIPPAVVDQFPDLATGRVFQMFQQADIAPGQVTLTLEVKVDLNAVFDLGHSSGKAGAGSGPDGFFDKDRALLPAFALSVAELDDVAVFVKAEHANLRTSRFRRRAEDARTPLPRPRRSS